MVDLNIAAINEYPPQDDVTQSSSVWQSVRRRSDWSMTMAGLGCFGN